MYIHLFYLCSLQNEFKTSYGIYFYIFIFQSKIVNILILEGEMKKSTETSIMFIKSMGIFCSCSKYCSKNIKNMLWPGLKTCSFRAVCLRATKQMFVPLSPTDELCLSGLGLQRWPASPERGCMESVSPADAHHIS